jgi:hypothetical protein
MPVIRIPEADWGKVWRFLVSTGPIGARLAETSKKTVYLVSERQLQLLRKKKLPFELLSSSNGASPKKRNG